MTDAAEGLLLHEIRILQERQAEIMGRLGLVADTVKAIAAAQTHHSPKSLRDEFAMAALSGRAVEEAAKLFKAYGVTRVVADRWGSGFVSEACARQGLRLQPAEMSKSDFYLELLPMIASGAVRFIQNDRLINQLLGLERRTSRGGRDSIDHPTGNFHDDICNSAAIAAVTAKAKPAMKISDDMLRRASQPTKYSLNRRAGLV